MDSRLLTAIMFTDVTGSSSMMGKNEAHGMKLVQKQREVIENMVPSYNGRIVKWMGDGSLSLFPSAVDAVKCAMVIQNNIRIHNLGLAEEDQMGVRIGIHIGDVALKDGDAFGNDVNVAARLEPMAESGGICISRDVYNRIKGKIEVQAVSIGEQQLKNIEETIELYRILLDSMNSPKGSNQAGDIKTAAAEAAISKALASAPAPPPPAATAKEAPSTGGCLGKVGAFLLGGGSFLILMLAVIAVLAVLFAAWQQGWINQLPSLFSSPAPVAGPAEQTPQSVLPYGRVECRWDPNSNADLDISVYNRTNSQRLAVLYELDPRADVRDGSRAEVLELKNWGSIDLTASPHVITIENASEITAPVNVTVTITGTDGMQNVVHGVMEPQHLAWDVGLIDGQGHMLSLINKYYDHAGD